jgi:crotonobetainyl-CoA:carnitine CoA-transferase CaiB-like acyl-CoA transferase
MDDESVLGPLDGIRVVDFTQIAAGPYCSSLLGDLGADVVGIEPPGGEPFRSIDEVFGDRASAYYFGVNRSKRSMTLDLKHPSAPDLIDRLIAGADVCMVGFRMDAVRRLRLDYPRLSVLNPRLIYCSVTAFGETGPRSELPGMDILAQALSGVMGLTGEPGRPPVKVGPPIADFVVSFLAGFAILAALRARDRDGIGQKVSLNLLDGQLATLANYVTPYLKTRQPIRPVGGGHPQLVPYQVFEAADGYFIVACLNDRFWPPLCRAIGRQDLLDDPELRTNVGRVRNRERLVADLAALFATAPAATWVDVLEQGGVPCSEVHRLEDALEDPQIVHNGMVVELEHPRYGRYSVVDNPMRLERTPAVVRRRASDIGEHTVEVLGELGYSAEEVHELQERGVV